MKFTLGAQDRFCTLLMHRLTGRYHIVASQTQSALIAALQPAGKEDIILAAGVLVTLEPLPFANAEGPLKLLASDRSPAPHTDPTSHTGEAQAPSAHTGLHAHSPSKSTAAPGDTL